MASRPELPIEVREVANALISSLGDNLTALLWHGSWARGEQTAESDHDMIVVVKLLNDDATFALQRAFDGRSGWSTYVKTEEELRQYPVTGRLQFHYGYIALYGGIDPPPVTRLGLIDDLRRTAVDVQHECRYRLIHASGLAPSRTYSGPDGQVARVRNARWMYYQAKLAVLALKAREVLAGREYPLTRAELRKRLTDAGEIAVVDAVDRWNTLRPEVEEDFRPVALLLDRVMRGIVAWLESHER